MRGGVQFFNFFFCCSGLGTGLHCMHTTRYNISTEFWTAPMAPDYFGILTNGRGGGK